METFLDFFTRNQQSLNLPSPGEEKNTPVATAAIANQVGLALEGADIAGDDVVKFASQVGSLVTGEPFIKELSQKIGQPASSESEEMFVERCKTAMIELLRHRLG